MSPEQLLASSRVGPETDVWALGVVVYELLTGVAPFEGATLAAIHVAILERPAPPLCLPGVQEETALAAIVHRCLQKRPEDRYRSIGEFANALARLSNNAADVSLPVLPAPRGAADPGRITSPIIDADVPNDTDAADTGSLGSIDDGPSGLVNETGIVDGGEQAKEQTDTSWDTDGEQRRRPKRGRLFLAATAFALGGGILWFQAKRDPASASPEAAQHAAQPTTSSGAAPVAVASTPAPVSSIHSPNSEGAGGNAENASGPIPATSETAKGLAAPDPPKSNAPVPLPSGPVSTLGKPAPSAPTQPQDNTPSIYDMPR